MNGFVNQRKCDLLKNNNRYFQACISLQLNFVATIVSRYSRTAVLTESLLLQGRGRLPHEHPARLVVQPTTPFVRYIAGHWSNASCVTARGLSVRRSSTVMINTCCLTASRKQAFVVLPAPRSNKWNEIPPPRAANQNANLLSTACRV